MAFRNTYFLVVDNTGALLVKCLTVYHKLSVIRPGSLILVTIKKVLANKAVHKGQIFKAVVVRLKQKHIRFYKIMVNYFINAVVLLKKTELIPLGTRIYGSVYMELRINGFMKI